MRSELCTDMCIDMCTGVREEKHAGNYISARACAYVPLYKDMNYTRACVECVRENMPSHHSAKHDAFADHRRSRTRVGRHLRPAEPIRTVTRRVAPCVLPRRWVGFGKVGQITCCEKITCWAVLGRAVPRRASTRSEHENIGQGFDAHQCFIARLRDD